MIWTEVSQTLSYFLDDNPKEGESKWSYPTPLRVIAWNWAQDIFASHTAMQCSQPLILDGNGRSAPLPDRLLRVRLVYDLSKSKTYTPINLVQGGQAQAFNGQVYWVWGGHIHFGQALPADANLVMDYAAQWPDVECELADGKTVVTQPVVSVPNWARQALCHLTAAGVLQPQAIAAAIARNYNMRIDSGTPDDNARQKQAWEHWKWYQALVSVYPPQG